MTELFPYSPTTYRRPHDQIVTHCLNCSMGCSYIGSGGDDGDGETKMLMMPKLVLFTVRRHLAGPSDERGLGAATK